MKTQKNDSQKTKSSQSTFKNKGRSSKWGLSKSSLKYWHFVHKMIVRQSYSPYK